MLDEMLKIAADVLKAKRAEVDQAREALLAEAASEDGRYAARTQLIHPEGSSTPLTQAADRAQQTLAKLRKPAVEALAVVLAFDVARQLRDETAAARDRHRQGERDRQATGLHPKVRDFIGRLKAHGVSPHTVAQHRAEDVAIIADLMRWKGHDPLYGDPDNPWRAIFQVYSTRLIAQPGGSRKVKRSSPGQPVLTRKHAADQWYMFNEIAAKIGDIPPANAPAPDPQHAVGATSAKDAAGGSDTTSRQATSSATGLSAAQAKAPISQVPLVADQQDASKLDGPVRETIETDTVERTARMPLSSERAQEIAETLIEQSDNIWSLYWPAEGVERNDYTPERLIPALERAVVAEGSRSIAAEFLAAARAGEAQTFMSGVRQKSIGLLKRLLMANSEIALAAARKAGFDV